MEHIKALENESAVLLAQSDGSITREILCSLPAIITVLW